MPFRLMLFVPVTAFLISCSKPVETRESPVVVTKPTIETVDPRPVIACFGDSLSAGYGLEPGKSFPDVLQQLIDAKGYQFRVANYGVSGDTTTDGVERLSTVISTGPKIVVLEFGGNDGLRGLPVASTSRNMATMVEGFQSNGAKVLLAGMSLPRNYGPEYISSFERVYVDIAKRYQLVRIPFLLEGVGGNPTLTQPDGIHPTAEGARIVAGTVMRYLEPLLQ
ncbi:MAG TPA: arylesterase [Bryobacteraceae bacterium]|nr:arylesterase [Bryobacteraceae bacterium]